MIKRCFNGWCKLGFIAQLTIIAILCGAIIFGPMFAREDWSNWDASEESYVALENVVYTIVEQKNAIQPLSDSLEKYEILVNEDKTIEVKLYSNIDMAYVDVTFSEEYQIKELERQSETLEYLLLIIIFTIILSYDVAVILYLVGLVIYLICRWIKKGKDKNKKIEDV